MEVFRILSSGFDPAPLLARLTPEMWEEETRRQDAPGSPHKDTKMIVIRWADLGEGEDPREAVFRNLDSIDWPYAIKLMPEIGEAVMTVLDCLGDIKRFGRVMLTKLPPGGRITEHIDEGLYADYHDRFILRLWGGYGNVFYCDGQRFRTCPGDAFWFNHKREHSFWNNAKQDQINLILDAMAPRFTALRGVCYQAERASDIWDEIQDLLQAHWKEIAHYQDIPLVPDREAYMAAETQGQLRVYTVRDTCKLVGYGVFFVKPNIHYSTSLQAVQDILFLSPEYRKGRVGIQLIKHAERALAAEGVQAVYHHVKCSNQVGRLLARMGYELIDEVYGKRLDQGV